ncbi:MAG TPA: hypothetical protein VGI91_01540 [Steroidobacteraceae bacterium]|jgi:hypothetical protein
MKKRGKSKSKGPSSARAAPTGGDAKVQGEGDYAADRRYRQRTDRFLKSTDVEAAAREAAPKSGAEAREMAAAEKQGRAHAHVPSGRTGKSRGVRRER